MNKERILKEFECENLKMPKKIYIGDSEMIDCFGTEYLTYIYDKAFRKKEDWLGYIDLKNMEYTTDDYGNLEMTITDVCCDIIFAKDNNNLDVFKKNMRFNYQKIKTTEIIVERAEYNIIINNEYYKVETMSDGSFGEVYEFYNGNKLEGIKISISFGEEELSTVITNLNRLLGIDLNSCEKK